MLLPFESEGKRRFMKARGNVAARTVFFASVIYGAEIEETDRVPTAATNGRNIMFNPEYILSEEAHAEGIMLHETLHCVLDHVKRGRGLIPLIWNVACDFSINPLVLQYFTLPKGALVDKRYEGMSPERIYELLLSEATVIEPGSGEMQDDDEADFDAVSRRWSRIRNLAAERAQKAGALHGNLKVLLDELNKRGRTDWRRLVRDWVRDTKDQDTSSWAYRNRRFPDMIMPGNALEKISKIVLAMDSSGSITSRPDVVKQMRQEAKSLLEQGLVDTVLMVSTDTEVCSQELVDTPEGAAAFDLGDCGGGTNFDKAMEEIAKHKDAMGCVFFSDMDSMSFGENPKMPVVWVDWGTHGSGPAFGRVVKYEP